MAKRFRLKFSSLRFCRSKHSSAALYRLSPVNPKVIDISLPAPPPSTPRRKVHCEPDSAKSRKWDATEMSSNDWFSESAALLSSYEFGTTTATWPEDETGSLAVLKKSEDPYGDFRRSMMEMIVEKQMVEAEELEQLLHCFLSLNSRCYHRVIVEAFSDIWDLLFRHPLTAL